MALDQKLPKLDFAAFAVGESRELPSGEWDDLRPLYEECLAYVRACEKPRPQFEFEQTAKPTDRSFAKWAIRRVR